LLKMTPETKDLCCTSKVTFRPSESRLGWVQMPETGLASSNVNQLNHTRRPWRTESARLRFKMRLIIPWIMRNNWLSRWFKIRELHAMKCGGPLPIRNYAGPQSPLDAFVRPVGLSILLWWPRYDFQRSYVWRGSKGWLA
jgi:hypothetical protein